jgi:hypothetical protein
MVEADSAYSELMQTEPRTMNALLWLGADEQMSASNPSVAGSDGPIMAIVAVELCLSICLLLVASGTAAFG